MQISNNQYDVIVAGGGPAGSTAATLLAQHGHRVLLAERSLTPRFKVGESLMPATYWTFERLGVLDKMRRSRFVQKHSVQFYGPSGRASAPFYFSETEDHESSQTWQVLRSEFDQMLLDNASEQGVEVHRGLSVQELLSADGKVSGVRVAPTNGEPIDLGCKVFVDATGQSAWLGRRLGLLTDEPRLRNVSYFTHYRGAHRESGIDEGATVIYHTADKGAWFWYIPLPDDRVSIGVVGPVDRLVKGRVGDPQQVFEEELASCPALVPRLEGARQVHPMKAIRDFSYKSREIAGDGWVLVGDALGFIDPIYSTGIFLALKSGEMAADSIHESLAAGDLSAASLGRFGEEITHGMEAMRKLVYAYYDHDFSFAEFLGKNPECRLELVHMLVGNFFHKPVDNLIKALDERQMTAARS